MKEALFGISLKSCGHIFSKKGRRIDRPVGREDWLLFYVAKGTEAFTLKDGDANAPAGSFIFYRPGEPQSHRYFGDKTGEFYYIHFTAPEDFSLFGFESSRIYRSLPSLQINELFEEVIREVQTKEYGYEKISISRFFSLICLFERRCRGISEKPKKHEGEISAVIQIMNKEYYVNYTLSDYAEMARMSKYHFLRTFKEIIGLSPFEYRAGIRLERAAELLRLGTAPIGEIAASVGYNSQNYFSDAFKSYHGLSPTDYRKNKI
jgi:AraC-like DNA-binding protein